MAQSGGAIGLYSDNPGWSDCALVETIGVPNTIYVAHVAMLEARAVRFAIQENWDGPIDVDFLGHVTSGDIFTGVTVWYPQCVGLPYLIATLQITPLVPAPPCTVFFTAVPPLDSTAGEIEVTDCNAICWFAFGDELVVNPNAACPCNLDGPLRVQTMGALQCDPVAAEPSTWGAVKALYQ